MSKGSKRRPRKVSREVYESNWNKIFGRVSSSEQSLENESEGDVNSKSIKKTRELGGRKGPEPTRYGDWEKSGRCIDF